MKNLYDILNIGNANINAKIEESISKTKNILKDLTQERTCIIYTNYLYENLIRNHVVSRKINTKDLGYDYEHHFILIPVNSEESYIVDLTFSQFKIPSDFFDLLNKGYQKVSNLKYNEYLDIITNESKISLIDEAYTGYNKLR